MIVRGYGRIAFGFERLDARLDRRLVDTHNFVMLVHVDIEGFAERYDQMLFVQLRVALDRFMFDVLGDFAQFGQGFVFQFVMCVRHRLSIAFVKINNALWYKSASEISRRGASCRVQLQRAQHPPGDLEKAQAELQAEIYRVPVERLMEHGRLRADAMTIRDKELEAGGVTEADRNRISELLRQSWRSLATAVKT